MFLCNVNCGGKHIKPQIERLNHMAISYNGLWKLLIDNNMNKTDLMKEVKLSSGTIAKMSKGEPVSMQVLEKICENLDCDFGDLVHYEKSEKVGDKHE